MKALILNCTLKGTDETSNTAALLQEAVRILEEEDVETETIRPSEYQIAHGVTPDAGNGDQWPEIYKKVKDANILIIGTPIWLGEKSSIATQVIERLYGASSETNEKGQSIYYNKVGAAVVTGNEDGGKHAAASIVYSLAHMGFTIPPNPDSYWVGDAGPGPSYIEADGEKNDYTMQTIKFLSHNLVHFARMLEKHPIPAEGNTLE